MKLRLTGSGGQGVILLGVILADAAIRDGKNAIQSQSYGPEARGGSSKCEVIVSESPIYYPKVVSPEFVLALSQESVDKYCKDLNEDCIVLVDSSLQIPHHMGTTHVHSLPMIYTAAHEINRVITTNIVALGCIVSLLNTFNYDKVKEALFERVPQGTILLNEEALHAGMELVNHENSFNT